MNCFTRKLVCLVAIATVFGCWLIAPAQIPINPNAKPAAGGGLINGGGSSFVNPVMTKWAFNFNAKTHVRINYQSIGSGAGIRQFIQKTVQFGATDTPMNDQQLKEAGAGVLHIPVVMGSVAVAYNIPSIGSKPLRLSGPVVADIFLGKIQKWNDPRIVSENPGLSLPASGILVTHRSDGSGTTAIFTDFLCKVSPEWKQKVGSNTSVQWPTGIGGKGNEGVAAQAHQISNTIGYVELVYALETHMPVAAIRNASGEFIQPSVESVTAAAASLATIPQDLRFGITNAPGKTAYSIAGLSWVLARTKMDNAGNAKQLKAFFEYILSDEAQSIAESLHYSKLPPPLLERARAKVAEIQ
jgi:phosphate transport system substrate-binding protein